MNSAAFETRKQNEVRPEDWDALRGYFQDSVMAQTKLASLAAEVGMKWPIRGKDETPERYIHFSLEQLADMEEFYGKGGRLELLYSILHETKQLEEPFLDMTRHLEAVALKEVEDPPLLRQLGVPADFPVDLMNFSEKTRAVCRDGGNNTLTGLMAFLQKSMSAVMLNDEFRQFHNCMEQADASGLAKFLPIREGAKGIFLAEAVGNVGRRLSDRHAATLIQAYRITTTNNAWNAGSGLGKNETLALIAKVKASVQEYVALMPEQGEKLREAVQSGLNASVRYFVSLKDPDLESLSIAIAMAACDVKPRHKGILGNLLS
jgi:hypothetical protein